jgi:pimeloyl-ACP methyl ester carboxylesterase
MPAVTVENPLVLPRVATPRPGRGDAAPGNDRGDRAGRLRGRGLPGPARLREDQHDGFDPALPELLAGEPPAAYVPLLDAMAACVRPETMRTQLPLMTETDQRDLLPTVSVPTFLLWGEQDVRSPLAVARQFQEAIPDAELVVIPGAGHVRGSNLERPKEFNRAVRGFCHAHS